MFLPLRSGFEVLFLLLWGLGGEVALAGLQGEALLTHFHFQAMVAAILLHISGGKLQQIQILRRCG